MSDAAVTDRPPGPRTSHASTGVRRPLIGLALVLAGLLPAVGFLVLPAVDWPAIAQGMPATEALPKVAANETAFRVGFAAMTAGAVAFLPAALYVARLAGGRFLTGLALASAVLRPLWYGSSLTVIPVLQDLWADGDAGTRTAVDVFYIGYNDLLSTVQEDIGVNIFGGLFAVVAATAMWRRRTHPRGISALGVAGGLALLVSSSELIGVANGPIVPILGPVLTGVWFAALGVVELMRSRVSPIAPVS